MSRFLESYNKLTKLPLGRVLLNNVVGLVAPFFGKIKPNILMLKPSYCLVEMKDRRGVRNHIGSVNAGALCTLAELTGGMALDATVDKSLRWIPKSMSVEYIKIAKGTLRAVSDFNAQIVREGDVVIPVVVENTAQEIVFKAHITFYISKR